ncbi:FAD-dependent oxidoreductase [Ferroacidibacillus organovorans]|uniref:FAD-dependent oxidoreductase n=1 Tax=Ferroacidibacillus organovorans TaxID=1765683 RepID=UPI000A89F27F|nr:FAD-dependent oxidoreductase [Ferroacidibacillus organovorans]
MLFERGEHVSFANCGLPYYVGGVITERDALLLHTPSSLKKRFDITVLTQHEVTEIDRERKLVHVVNRTNGVHFEESYDKLVLAVGARPLVPNLPGINLPGIFELRTVPDADAMKAWIDSQNVRRAVVVGAGFIGMEVVENLTHLGIDVTLIEKADQVLPPFDREMTASLREELKERGVETILGDGIVSFQGQERATDVLLESGRVIQGDLFLLGIGVRPDFTLAKNAGLELGVAGAVHVNQELQTSDPNIYAAGDVAEMTHLVDKQLRFTPLAGLANKQARVIGQNVCGSHVTFDGALGTAIVKFGKATLALTGLTEKMATAQNLAYRVSYSTSGHHAGYYPGAKMMTIKLLVDPASHHVLGAQIAGEEGVDKRIDVIATGISAKLTIEEMAMLDLAYAPPFSSAKDPVVMAAMAAEHVIDGDVRIVHSLQEVNDLGAILVDVRDDAEVADGMLPGAIHIPLDELRARIGEIDQGRPVVVYCRSGQRSYFAYQILRRRLTSEVFNLTGGWIVQEMRKKTA